jgi:hypothetical protein
MIAVNDIRRLAAVQGPCLTILQPLRDDFSQVTKPDTRLTAAIRQADTLLAREGFDEAAREGFLRPLYKVARNTSLSGRTGSIVLFRAPAFTKASFWPDTLRPAVHLAHEFFVLPLLARLGAHRDFWILGLSVKRIRLFRGTMQGLKEVTLPKGMPQSVEEAGGFDQPDHDLENRSAAGPSVGQMRGVHFGTSADYETRAAHLHDFFKMIDRALRPILGNDPLILAAVARELSLYRAANTYAPLLDEAIHGSPEGLGKERLHEAALRLMAADAARAAGLDEKAMDTAAGRGLLLNGLPAIRQAAEAGLVERFLISADNGGNDTAANSIALAVIRNSGSVAASGTVPLPAGPAAILRYRTAAAPEPGLAA